MTNSAGRLYALAVTLAVFFLAWAVVAAHPWAAPAADKRLQTLAVREAQLRREGALVHRLVAQRWTTYRKDLRVRRAQIAGVQHRAAAASAAPQMRIVTLPPLTITRTS
jgi:hypothetical protein